MKLFIKRFLLAAALGLGTSAAPAHHISGSVLCTDTTPATPYGGVLYTVQGTLGTYQNFTLADGTFFINLPQVTDTYTVTIDTPAGLTITSPVGGQYVVQIFAGGVGGPDHFDGAHFALTGCAPPPPLGQIGDTVYCDANNNGIQDAGEAGIPGVKVTLLCKDANSNIVASAMAITDANGKYLFVNVPAGFCTVTVDGSTVPPPCNVPGVCVPSIDHVLGAGEIFLGADFCFTVAPICDLSVTKECILPPPPPTPFDCSDLKPIDTLKVQWNGSTSPIYVRAWNGAIGGSGVAQSNFGPINTGDIVTFTRSGTFPNDVFFEIFTDAARTVKLGKSTFHLSCSDDDMDGPEDCGKAAGDSKGVSGNINDWIFTGMSGKGKTLSCSVGPPAGSNSCTVSQAPMANCDTVGKPTSLTFRYTGGGCAASNNQQPVGTKFDCDDNGFDSALPILVGQNDQAGNLKGSQTYTIINDATGLPASSSPVLPGGTFTVSGSFKAQSYFTLNNQGGGGTESISIHTSCSQPLEVGDVFGSMTLVGFNGQTGGSSITYRYAVKNEASTALNNVFLTDDKLGDIAGPFSLAVGETKTFDVPVVVSGTITNTATATVQGVNCQASSGPVVVTVLPPPLPPFDCSDAKPIDTLNVQWNGSTSPIYVRTWNGAIGGSGVAQSNLGPINTGDIVTFTRSGTFPNDVYFEIFTDAARTVKLGNSTFHLSCSDEDMNGSEDCGKAAGDAKGKSGFINDWIFKGLAGSGRVLSCP